jgi:hypothetical protein
VVVFDFLCFLCLVDFGAGAGAAVVAVSAATGAAAGMLAAMDEAARPKVNKAEAIKIPDLFMRSPNGGM